MLVLKLINNRYVFEYSYYEYKHHFCKRYLTYENNYWEFYFSHYLNKRKLSLKTSLQNEICSLLPPLTDKYYNYENNTEDNIRCHTALTIFNITFEKYLNLIYREILYYQPKYNNILTKKEKEYLNLILYILQKQNICEDLILIILNFFLLKELTFDKKNKK